MFNHKSAEAQSKGNPGDIIKNGEKYFTLAVAPAVIIKRQDFD